MLNVIIPPEDLAGSLWVGAGNKSPCPGALIQYAEFIIQTHQQWFIAQHLYDQMHSFGLRQPDLAKWQQENFKDRQITTETMVVKATEELGELAHWVSIRTHKIREGANPENAELIRAQIADACADTIISCVGVMIQEGLDAEQVVADTLDKVLARDWAKNPTGKSESQHKELEENSSTLASRVDEGLS